MNGDTCKMCGSEDVSMAGHSWMEVTCQECGFTGKPVTEVDS